MFDKSVANMYLEMLESELETNSSTDLLTETVEIDNILFEAYDEILFGDNDDDVMTEGANLEYHKKIKELKKHVALTMKQYKLAMKNNDFSSARKYANDIISYGEKIIKEIKNIDSSSFETFIGNIYDTLKWYIKIILICLAVGVPTAGISTVIGVYTKSKLLSALGGALAAGGIAAVIIKIKEKEKEIEDTARAFANNAKAEDSDKAVTSRNKYRNNILANAESIVKYAESLKQLVDEKEKKYKETQKMIKVKESALIKNQTDEVFNNIRHTIYEECQNGLITEEEREEQLSYLRDTLYANEITAIESFDSDKFASKEEIFDDVKRAIYERCARGEFNEETRENLIREAYDDIFVESTIGEIFKNKTDEVMKSLNKTKESLVNKFKNLLKKFKKKKEDEEENKDVKVQEAVSAADSSFEKVSLNFTKKEEAIILKLQTELFNIVQNLNVELTKIFGKNGLTVTPEEVRKNKEAAAIVDKYNKMVVKIKKEATDELKKLYEEECKTYGITESVNDVIEEAEETSKEEVKSEEKAPKVKKESKTLTAIKNNANKFSAKFKQLKDSIISKMKNFKIKNNNPENFEEYSKDMLKFTEDAALIEKSFENEIDSITEAMDDSRLGKIDFELECTDSNKDKEKYDKLIKEREELVKRYNSKIVLAYKKKSEELNKLCNNISKKYTFTESTVPSVPGGVTANNAGASTPLSGGGINKMQANNNGMKEIQKSIDDAKKQLDKNTDMKNVGEQLEKGMTNPKVGDPPMKESADDEISNMINSWERIYSGN